ncbi:MAG TPA: hypothetical protein VN026_09910 [Bacteroidia bacterium]|jgi:uncharacterized membrane protein|nr:hypothetical protein [Bacteroidia bacterium]
MKSKEDTGLIIREKNGLQVFFHFLLGVFLMYAGLSHLTFSRMEFRAQVPNWVPLDKDLTVVLSGIAEILLGGSLIFLPKHRVTMGWVAAIFFILAFPGNIAQYLNKINAFGLDTNFKRGLRLFFQPLFVIWALWSTGAWKAWRLKKRIY